MRRFYLLPILLVITGWVAPAQAADSSPAGVVNAPGKTDNFANEHGDSFAREHGNSFAQEHGDSFARERGKGDGATSLKVKKNGEPETATEALQKWKIDKTARDAAKKDALRKRSSFQRERGVGEGVSAAGGLASPVTPSMQGRPVTHPSSTAPPVVERGAR